MVVQRGNSAKTAAGSTKAMATSNSGIGATPVTVEAHAQSPKRLGAIDQGHIRAIRCIWGYARLRRRSLAGGWAHKDSNLGPTDYESAALTY